MTWIEQTPTARARIWRDDATGQYHSSSLVGTSLAYEGVLDSGVFDTPVSLTPQRITGGGNDGWRVTANQFHYFLGQPAGRATDGWVGFGGRQGAHWLSSRLVRVGYLHWPTRAWDDIGGAPTYTRAGRLTRTDQTRAIGPAGVQVTQTLENLAQWTGIWTTPGSGDVTIRWRVNGRGLKEEIVLNAAARTWITANRAPATPASETWFSFTFQMDWTDIPRVLKNSVLQDIEGDFDDDGGSIRLETALNEVLAFLPLDNAYVNTSVDFGGVPRATRAYLPLRKRIYKDGSNYYLIVGARVDQLAALPAGDVIFDPTFIIAETNEDGYSEGTDENVLPSQGAFANSLGYYTTGAAAVDGGWIFRSTGIASGDTIDTATLNLEYNGVSFNLPLDGSIFGFAVDTPTDFDNTHTHRISDHHTRTSASVAANIPTAADYTSASLVTILQEIVDRAGFAGDIGLCWREASTNQEYWDWTDYTTSAALAAELTVTFTAAAAEYELEGYRFRNDNGSETTATWRQAQDTSDSIARLTNIRLRPLVNVTGDAPSQGYRLEYRKPDSLDWRRVQ